MERIRKRHLLMHPERYRYVRRGKVGTKDAMAFTILDPRGREQDVVIWWDYGLQVRMAGADEGSEASARWLQEALTGAVREVEDELIASNITFVWVKGERIEPEEMPSMLTRLLGRLFSRTLLLLNILLFGFNIVLFLIFGLWAVMAILGVQLLLIVFADRLFGLVGKWEITPSTPQVFLLQISVSNATARSLVERRVDLSRLKQAVFDSSLARGSEPSCSTIGRTLQDFGVTCSEDSIRTRTVNVLELVKRAVGPFNAPLPRIMISNSLVPNAAASGISFRRGVVLLTGGILSLLSDDELVSVIGHELGHLKGKDPLLLFALVSGEFLLRLTVLFPLFVLSPFLYLIVSTFLIFFIAKFFEARADLLSVMTVGQPKVLAESLRKIGSQRLQMEKAFRLGSWLSWDPHPPLYFRIERLEGMSVPVEVKHPLLESARDVIKGFRAALAYR